MQIRQVPQPTSAVHLVNLCTSVYGSAFVPGRKCCAKFTDQPKKKQKNADKVTRKENPQLKSEARPSPSASSSSPERSVDRGARTITRLENKIYLID